MIRLFVSVPQLLPLRLGVGSVRALSFCLLVFVGDPQLLSLPFLDLEVCVLCWFVSVCWRSSAFVPSFPGPGGMRALLVC